MWCHIDQQRADLADFLDGLTPHQWAAPSLCTAWTVRDVAAHLTQSTTGWLRLGIEVVRYRFRFDPMVADLARGDGKSPEEITAALRAMVGVRKRPPGTTVADPLTDVLVHGQDIAVPLGLSRTMPVEPAVVAAERLWGMRFPLHPRKHFPGIELVATDTEFSVGSGRVVSGTIADIVLAMAGRDSVVSAVE